MQKQLAPNFDILYDRFAQEQSGFFTAQQAKQAGFSTQLQSYYVKQGKWDRQQRGIFWLRGFPLGVDGGHHKVAYLWTCNKEGIPIGIISHDTALDLYNLTSQIPDAVHLSVPKRFNRRDQCRYRVRLHRRELSDSDVTHHGFMRITTVLRSILDVLIDNTMESKHFKEAIISALASGKVTHQQLVEATLSKQEERLMLQLLLDIRYEKFNDYCTVRGIKKPDGYENMPMKEAIARFKTAHGLRMDD